MKTGFFKARRQLGEGQAPRFSCIC